MPITSLMLDYPISRESIQLGRLVLEPKYPSQDFYQPSLQSRDVTTQRLENFHETLDRARTTRLEINLLSLLTLAPSSAPKTSSATIRSPLCAIHQLRDPVSYFRSACRGAPGVRSWLEAQARGLHSSSVYLVCGLKTLTDAEVAVSRAGGARVEVSAGVPAAALLAGVAGVPGLLSTGLSDAELDLSVGLSLADEHGQTTGYTATGEQVFAVQYRKIKFSIFSSRSVDKAYLERGHRWKSFLGARAGDGVDDGIDAEVSDPISLSDLMGEYESLELDGEKILYRVTGQVDNAHE